MTTTKSIMVVEDDDVLRGVVCRSLGASGYRVSEAAGGRQALSLLSADTPDLLITDIMMHDGDGIELVPEVRRAFPNVIVLVVSGRRFLGTLDLLRLSSSLGAHATLEKPFDIDHLHEVVAGLLDSSPG